MAIVSDQIVDEFLAALDGAGKPAGLTVEEHTAVSLEPDRLPYMSIRPGLEKMEGDGNDWDSYHTQRELDVVVAAWAESATSPRKALSPLIGWATKALRKSAVLRSLTKNVVEVGAVWSDEFTDQNRGLVEITFRVSYYTLANDQEAET